MRFYSLLPSSLLVIGLGIVCQSHATSHFSSSTEVYLNNTDTITLVSDTIGSPQNELQEVVIEADRMVLKEKGISLFPSKRDKRFASGGIDVLRNMNVPEIKVDPMTNTVTTSGGENIAMFVDFIPASSQQIRDLRPQDIERIDILRTPSDPRFEGAKVVANFIMKKYVYGGYTKGFSAQHFPLSSANYSLYTKFSFKRMTYDLSTGFGYSRAGNESGYNDQSLYKFSSGNLERTFITNSFKSRSLYPNVSARILYKDNNCTITNSFGFNYTQHNPIEREATVDFSDIFNSSHSLSHSEKRNKGVSWRGNYYFRLNNTSSLSFNGNASWGRNLDNSNYTLGGYSPIINNIREDLNSGYAGLTFQKRFNSHSAGLTAGGGWNANTLAYLSADATDVRYRESFASIRLFSNLSLGVFSISPNLTLLYEHEKINEETQVQWYPKAFVPFYLQISRRQSMNGSFEFALGAPAMSSRSPVLVRSNEVDAVRGNENLEFYRFYKGRLGYSHYFANWLRARVDASFQAEDNYLMPLYSEEMSPEGTPMMVCQRINDGMQAFGRIGLTLSGEYFNSLQVSVSATACNFTQRGLRRRNVWYPELTVNATYYLRSFMFSAYYGLPAKSYSSWSDDRYPAFYRITAGWSWNDLFVELLCDNFFRSSYIDHRSVINAPLYSRTRTVFSADYHRGVTLTLSYSFGYGKKVNRQDEVSKMDNGQSIILR